MGEFPSVDLVSGVAVVIPFKIKKRERANQHTKIEKRREPTYRKGENEGKMADQPLSEDANQAYVLLFSCM